MSSFAKAVRTQKRLRLGIAGGPGSGKTMTGLRFAHVIARAFGRGRVGVVDSENGSAALYQGESYDGGVFDFSILTLSDYSPVAYKKAIDEAANEFDVLLVDSLTHAWAGPGGALDIHTDVTRASGSKNSYFAWRDVTPMHNALVESILRSPCHVIATLRTKVEYVLENEGGKVTPKKVGMKPVQREGMEYEFDVFADVEIDTHLFAITKTRCASLDGKKEIKPGAAFIAPLLDWLKSGADATPPAPRDLTQFEQFYNRILAASSDADIGKIGLEVQSAKAALSAGEYDMLVAKGKERLAELTKAPAMQMQSEPETPPPSLNGNTTLEYGLLAQQIEIADNTDKILEAGRNVAACRDKLAVGEFEKLVTLGKSRLEKLTGVESKSPA